MPQKLGTKKVCIASIHGTTEYEIYLTTNVVDKFDNGFPTCFCFSKKKDA